MNNWFSKIAYEKIATVKNWTELNLYQHFFGAGLNKYRLTVINSTK